MAAWKIIKSDSNSYTHGVATSVVDIDNTCSTKKEAPQAQSAGARRGGHPYKAKAS